MFIYTLDQISHLHIEPTTQCNAACPMCARNAFGKICSGLTQESLTVNDFKKLCSPSFLAQIKAIDFCGAYGDPIISPHIIDILEYIYSCSSDCIINLFTNGGMNSQSWWQNLAALLGNKGRVVFAIDGLEDTNHIYRRGVKFSRVIDNARAFINAGGYAQWDFLIFRHNEHQIKEAQKLSEEIGFKELAFKKTARFLKSQYDYVPELSDDDSVNRFPIYSASGHPVGFLEPPSNPSLINKTAVMYTSLLEQFESLDSLFSQTPINCRARENSSLFISASGHVFPCCWTYVQATTPIIHDFASEADTQIYDLVQECGGFDRILALKHGLDSALASPFFEAITKRWKQPSIIAGRPKVCARVCGLEFGAFSNQFQSADLIPGISK